MQKRNLNVDLFRVLATIFVVILHVLGRGGILWNLSSGNAKYWVVWFIEMMAFCAVNCFGIISGYVMVNRTVKLKNIVGLWLQVLFYSLVITALCFWLVPETRSRNNLLIAFVPVLTERWWYVSSYFALFFMIPVLNAAIDNLPQKAHRKFLLIILVGVCVADCIITGDPFVMDEGYSPAWLGVLYFMGAYIRKYDLQKKMTASKSAIAFFTVVSLTVLCKACIRFVEKKLSGGVKYENIFMTYTSIMIVLAAVFLFFFCLNVKLGNTSKKVIRFFAPATFGVYLIHTHALVFDYVLKDSFAAFRDMPLFAMLSCVLIATAAIFLLCSAMDLLRIQLFRVLKVDRLSEIMSDRITKLWQKVFGE